jgi:diguanylate cyclase (GGDEF)-like protein
VSLALSVVLALGVGGLVAIQWRSAVESSGRRLGFGPAVGREGILVSVVEPDLPADRAGLRAGDQLVVIGGLRTVTFDDYERAAARFVRGEPVLVRVLRGGRARDLRLVPGVPPDWFSLAVLGLTTLGFLALALLALNRRTGDLQGHLFLLFTAAVTWELALPVGAIGSPVLLAVALSAYYLLTGLQIGLELHLAALIPDRHPWVSRRPWLIPSFYVLGVGLGLLTCATYVAEEVLGWQLFPWSASAVDTLLLAVAIPVWALAVVVLLGYQALRYPAPRGRHQAGLVLAGVLPWCAFVLVTSALTLAHHPVPPALSTFQPLALLCYPIAFFAAIYRYHLFDIELVVRRSLIYTTLTGILFLVFYAALGAGGVLATRLVGGDASVWPVSAATLVLGLLFAPLRRTLQVSIGRRFFPERYALRQRLIALAGELPAQGKLPRMGEHLVARLCEVFAARSATLLIADSGAGFLCGLASTLPTGLDNLDQPPFLTLEDPGIDLLRRTGRPIPAEQATVRSPVLDRRLAPLDAALAVPLLSHNLLVGVLLVGRKEGGRAYPAEEIDLLGLLARHVATVFENVRLFESATYESLTGLLRRETILEQLGRELERVRRYRRPLTIAMADLDHFKEVNDRYGHLAGDALLKRISQVAMAGLRSTDWMGRYGGEEFLLVLPETDIEGASGVAEKIRALVQRTAVEMEDGSLARVTISIGLASLADVPAKEGRITARDLIAAADRSLYEAKNGGRNRVFPLVA